jgi:hypothetical protein
MYLTREPRVSGRGAENNGVVVRDERVVEPADMLLSPVITIGLDDADGWVCKGG